MRRFECFLTAVFCLAFTVNLISAENLPKYIQPTDEFVTKHITWNKPSFHGPLKVLFIAPRLGAREIVEVCERFDIQREVFLLKDYEVFAYDNSWGAWPYADEKSGTELLKNLLNKDYDVIVIGHIKWNALPDWAQTTILDKVRKGAGLLIRPRGKVPKEITDGLEKDPSKGPVSLSGYPFIGLPVFNQFETQEEFQDKYFKFGQMDQGRVIMMKNIPSETGYARKTLQILTPDCRDSFPDIYWIHYDYYQALLGHFFDWLAKKEPAVRTRVPEEVLRFQIPRKTLQTVRFNIISAADGEFDLEFALRDSCYGNVVASSTSNATLLKKGESFIPFPAPKVPAGNYFADLWVKKDGKVVNYGSKYLTVVSDNFIEKIELAKPFFGKDEPTSGSVLLKNCADSEKVLVRQVDNYGRVVAEQVLPATGNKVEFRMKPDGVPLTVVQTLEVSLMQEQETVDFKRQRFTYSELPLMKDVPVAMCQNDFGPSYLNRTLAEQFRKSGINSFLTWPNSDGKLRNMAGSMVMEDVRTMPVIYGRGMPKTLVNIMVKADAGPSLRNKYGLVRNSCLTDPEYTNAAQIVYSNGGELWRPFSPLFYNLGDECMVAPHGSADDLCFSETCIASFRSFLQQEYGTIAKLNDEYGTDYKSFDQALPTALEQVKANPKLIPIWIDHRRHMDSIWANYLDSARHSIQSQAPGARVGYDGSGETGHGPENGALTATDYWKLSRAMDVNFPYYWPFQLDCVRDLSEPGIMLGAGWFGGYTQMWRAGHDPVTQIWWLWNGFFRGANGISIYSGIGDVNMSTVAPDFSFEDFFKKGILEELKFINGGIGKLLTIASRENDNTAILYSPSSMLLSSVSKGMPDFWNSADGTPIFLVEALRQYRMVASPEVENSVLAKGEYRVLYLPCALALSDKETSEILNFARKGGVVIADMRPAVADQHGKPREKGALDELFGVKQNTANASMVTSRIDIGESTNIGLKDMPPLRVDSSLEITAGKALGKAGAVPVLVVNNYGKGKGVLLNMLLVDYLRSPKWSISRFATVAMAEKTGLLLQHLFSLAPAEQKMSFAEFVPGARIHRLKAGTTRLIGLTWDAQPFMPGADVWEPFDRDPERAKKGALELEKINAQIKTINLKLPEKVHLYDVFTGKYEGFVDLVQRQASPGKVYLFAAIPYKPSGLEIKAEVTGRDVRILADLKGAEKSGVHVFNLKFFGPDGKELEYYGRNIQADDGKVKYSFTLALNEQPGQWQVKATDIVTGLPAETSFVVK
ncbi:MAG: beta-galactosidase [Fibrobacterota bacterium]